MQPDAPTDEEGRQSTGSAGRGGRPDRNAPSGGGKGARLPAKPAPKPAASLEDLMKIIPKDRWILFSHQIIHHGRNLCVARKPRCVECPLDSLCYAKDKTI